ncbi:hypothetical protein [uncultured Tateyamaria sp.]|uniref:hypothetical protein n=1 Tax=uncultured Tateyamaria sp. TaxID=455651 RepID=UPI002618ED75|nr:hypothetical protein [uncultured Tateyamaria sp.]
MLRQKIRKSNVRIVVTYFVVFMYCTTATILTFVLLYIGKIELALGVFSGLSTLSAGIAGFWFGNRGTGYPEGVEAPGARHDDLHRPPDMSTMLMGTARRPVDGAPDENPAVFQSKSAEDTE